jgi:hypothetical protein
MRRPWRGRVRDRVWKTFVALAGWVVSTGELVRRCWPRKQRFDPVYYRRVRAAAAEIADPVGHQHRGRRSSEPGGILWRLREPPR